VPRAQDGAGLAGLRGADDGVSVPELRQARHRPAGHADVHDIVNPRTFLDAVAGTGIPFTVSELRVLFALPPHGEPSAVSVVDIAAYLLIPKPTVSRTLDFLARHALITRPRSTADQRRVVLNRTLSGDVLLDCVCGAVDRPPSGTCE